MITVRLAPLDVRVRAWAAADIGLTVGIQATDFGQMHANTPTSAMPVYASSGATFSVAAGRLSFVLGMQGPCYSTDTACSTALVAAHSASQMLRNEECEGALTMAVNLMLSPVGHLIIAIAGMTSADGRCKYLDSRANGYVRAEGIGCMMVEPSPAVNTKAAVRITCSAVRSDGRSASLTAPNGAAQVRLLRSTLKRSGVLVTDIWTVESHGTGTALGDPIEITALHEVVMMHTSLTVAGVKANLGHMEPAAGAVGLQRLFCTLQSARSAPNAQLRVLNHMVLTSVAGVAVGFTSVTVTAAASHSESLSGGISSFGYAGTIAHHALTAARGLSSTASQSRKLPVLKRRVFAWRTLPPPASKSSVAPQQLATASEGVIGTYVVRWTHLPLQQRSEVRESYPHSHVILYCTGTRVASHAESLYRTISGVVDDEVCVAHAAVGSAELVQRQFDVVLCVFCRQAEVMPALSELQSLLQLLLLVSSATLPAVFSVTSGTQIVAPNTAPPMLSGAAHGGVYGFTRALRLEHTSVPILSLDIAETIPRVPAAEGIAAQLQLLLARVPPMGEGVWTAQGVFVRQLAEASRASHKTFTPTDLYIVTGGLGGLGRQTSSMLAAAGVRRLLICSRRGRSEAVPERSSARIGVVACDTGVQADIKLLLWIASRSAYRLHGAVHAAGVLSNALFRNMTAQHMERVFLPKAIGAWLLHACASRHCLEAFGLFSSVTALAGGTGQSNYAAANAYLDTLAVSRRAYSLSSTSVQLPAVMGAGMSEEAFGASKASLPKWFDVSLDDFSSWLRATMFASMLGLEEAQASLLRAGAAAYVRDLVDVLDASFTFTPEAEAEYVLLDSKLTPQEVGSKLNVAADRPLVVQVATLSLVPSEVVAFLPLAVPRHVNAPILLVCCGELVGVASALLPCSASFVLAYTDATFRLQHADTVDLPAWANMIIRRRSMRGGFAAANGGLELELTTADALELGMVDYVGDECAVQQEVTRLLARTSRTSHWQTPLPCCVEEALLGQEQADLPPGNGELIRLQYDEDARVVVFELNDPNHYNMLTAEMADDMRSAMHWVRHRSRIELAAAVVQGKGTHFCPGGKVRLQDTMSSSGTMRLCTAAWGSLQFFSGFTDLRMLQAPVVCAAHGVVLGGGLAVALLTDYIVAEAAASFQVGELPRGIAPAGLLLLTLADAVGRARATSLYLSDKKLTAQAALAQRLVQEVREGTDATQEHALNLAFCFALSSCLELFKTNFLVGSAALSEYERATLAVGSFAQVGSAFCLPASASCSTSMLSSSCHIRHASFRYCIRECVLACTGEKCP